MNSLYFVIALLSVLSIAFYRILNGQNTDVPELAEAPTDTLLHQEVNMLLEQLNQSAQTEEERKAHYRAIKNKYREVFIACGQSFPRYEKQD